MSYSRICDLNGTKEAWSIQARVCRLWQAVDFKNGNDVFALEAVFVDDQGSKVADFPTSAKSLFKVIAYVEAKKFSLGDSIQGYVRKNHIARFKPLLREGEVYAIRNFKVGKASPQYKVVPNDDRLYFNITTSVRAITGPTNQIPPHAFSFVSGDILEQRIGNNTVLTDIIGCVVGAGPIEVVATGPKREIELKDNTGNLMRVTLWGTISSVFDSTPHEAAGTPIIAIITSTTVRKFKGDFSYRSTTASKLYFNLDLPQVHALAQVFANGYAGVKQLQHGSGASLPLAEQASVNRMTIRQLLDMEWVAENQEFFCTFVGEIVEITERHGWCYISCNHCSKKVVPKDGAFHCTPCNRPCLYPVIRYKIHARARDATSSTTLAIFNDDVERFVKVPATTFMERVATGDTGLPHEITNSLIGKTFVFKVKVTDYNLKDGFENYTVTRIFEVGNADRKRKLGEEDGATKGETSAAVESVKPSGEKLIPPITPQKKPIELKKTKGT